MKLTEIVDELETMYGHVQPEVTVPFDMIVFENAAYLVDDARRLAVFRKLRDQVGIEPEQILEHTPKEIEAVIADGGMLAPHRAAKVIAAARVAAKIGLEEIDRAIRTDPKKAKKLLKEFPGAGEPLADKILLFSGAHVSLAPDSNVLRVLTRLGYGVDDKNYAKSYRSAIAATKDEFRTPVEAQRAHLILRHRGQQLCKRSEPRCEFCPLRNVCAYRLR